MGKRNNHILRNAMFVVALLAVVAVCFVNLSSDEYADPIELKDGENTVATYELVGNTLTITAKSDYYSVSSIPDITGIDKTSVRTIYLENFLNQGVSSVFNKETYENLVDIHYKGTIDLSSTVVDYDFDITDSSLELSTSSLNCVLPDYELESTSPFSTYFFSSLAESIVLKGFQSGGANIFNCFTKVLSFHATDYNVINANLLNGLSSVNTLKFDSLNLDDNPSTDKKEAADFASAVKDTLVTVELASATDIGAYAFNNYTKLQSLIAPKLENIGSYAFNNADRLKVNFTDYPNLESIGGYAFANCGGLGDLVFPSKIKIIGSWAFNYTSLRSVSFANCTSLTQICGGAFGHNGNLSGDLVLPDSLIYLGDYTVGNIQKDNDTEGTFWGSQITSVTCGPNLLKVDQHSFWKCTRLKTVTLPASLEYIGTTAFIDCTSLTTVRVDKDSLAPKELVISSSAFNGCTALNCVR